MRPQFHTACENWKRGTYILGCLDTSKLDESGVLLDGVTDELGSLGLTLGLDHNRLLLLQSTLDNVLGALSVLLGDLLGLNSGRVFLGEGKVSDTDIIEDDIEFGSAAVQHLANLGTDNVTLREELRSVVLRDDSLGHFVHDGRKNTGVEIYELDNENKNQTS